MSLVRDGVNVSPEQDNPSTMHPQLSFKSLYRGPFTITEILLQIHTTPTSTTSIIPLWPLLGQVKIQEDIPEFAMKGFPGHSLPRLARLHCFL